MTNIYLDLAFVATTYAMTWFAAKEKMRDKTYLKLFTVNIFISFFLVYKLLFRALAHYSGWPVVPASAISFVMGISVLPILHLIMLFIMHLKDNRNQKQ